MIDQNILMGSIICAIFLNGFFFGLVVLPYILPVLDWFRWHGKPHIEVAIESTNDSLAFTKEWNQWATFKKEHPDFIILINGMEVH